MWRSRLESTAVLVALLMCAAFVASFLFGLRGSPPVAVLNPPSATQQEPPVRSAGRVEVLNASGRAGLARAATDRLRHAGYDVVFFGNAPAAAGDSSIVLDRTGTDAVARAAASHLGIAAVATCVDTTLFVDATVIIGADWAAATPAAAPADEPGWVQRFSRWVRPSR
jgi:hypothetical protein